MQMTTTEAAQEWRIDEMVMSPVINDDNLGFAFYHYSEDKLVELICKGEKFIRLDDGGNAYRMVDIEQIKMDVAQDDEFTFRLIEFALDKPEKTKNLVNARVKAIVRREIEQIKLDWEIV